MMNTGCEPAQLVSALSSDDPGTQNLVNALGMLPTAMVGATDVEAFNSEIPPVSTGSISGSETCIQGVLGGAR